MSFAPSGGQFTSARVKLSRASFAISSLERHSNEWIDKNPSQVLHERDDTTEIETVKLVVPELPLEVPLMTGEILHHIRGALDHMVTSIVGHITGLEDRRTNFPFHEDRRGFESLRNHIKQDKRHSLYNAAPGIWDLIENQIKPYRFDGGNHYLWAISKLNNTDKHRLLLASTTQSATSSDLGRCGYSNNMALLIGPGEMIVGRGSDLAPGPASRIEIILVEKDIMPDIGLFLFLKSAHDLVFSIVQQIETLFFAPDEKT